MAKPLDLDEALDGFERAVLFAIQEALRLDRERAAAEASDPVDGGRRLTIVEAGERGGQAA